MIMLDEPVAWELTDMSRMAALPSLVQGKADQESNAAIGSAGAPQPSERTNRASQRRDTSFNGTTEAHEPDPTNPLDAPFASSGRI